MTLLSDKEALYEKYRKETERLRKEILAEKSVMLKSMDTAAATMQFRQPKI